MVNQKYNDSSIKREPDDDHHETKLEFHIENVPSERAQAVFYSRNSNADADRECIVDDFEQSLLEDLKEEESPTSEHEPGSRKRACRVRVSYAEFSESEEDLGQVSDITRDYNGHFSESGGERPSGSCDESAIEGYNNDCCEAKLTWSKTGNECDSDAGIRAGICEGIILDDGKSLSEPKTELKVITELDYKNDRKIVLKEEYEGEIVPTEEDYDPPLLQDLKQEDISSEKELGSRKRACRGRVSYAEFSDSEGHVSDNSRDSDYGGHFSESESENETEPNQEPASESDDIDHSEVWLTSSKVQDASGSDRASIADVKFSDGESDRKPKTELTAKTVSDSKGDSKIGIKEERVIVRAGERPFECGFCNESFTRFASLRAHLRVHDVTNEIVPRKKSSKKKKTSGKNRSDGNKTCNICKKTFTFLCNLQRHKRLAHSVERPFKCTLCDKAYKANQHLKDHMRTHTGERPFKCEICHKAFRQRSSLISHRYVHDKGSHERKHQCEHCGKSFYSIKDMRNHVRVHTGERPYVCAVCKSDFTQKTHLNLHMRYHTGEKPFACRICDRRFYRRQHVTSHMKIHNKGWPFCEICKKTFRSAKGLQRHEKKTCPKLHV